MKPPDSEYDALLLVSFGGPEGPDDVIPFLENVLRGKPVPRERMLEVAEHYQSFGGVSPINDQCRALIAALRKELNAHGIELPIYWGNRNWHPMLADTMQEMADAGVKRALALMTAAYSSYSSCRQYREDVEKAREEVGAEAPPIDKIRVFYNHPDFVAASAECVGEALAKIPQDGRAGAHIVFTAHSIPMSMSSGCDYVIQLEETCRLVAEQLGVEGDRWKLVYQSRSGRPQDPWLEPDVVDYLRELHSGGVAHAVVMPIGFLSDHMEVLFDLDHEAQDASREIGLNMVRAETVGTRQQFVGMLRKLIEERIAGGERLAIGDRGPNHDVCPVGCCLPPQRPGRPTRSQQS